MVKGCCIYSITIWVVRSMVNVLKCSKPVFSIFYSIGKEVFYYSTKLIKK